MTLIKPGEISQPRRKLTSGETSMHLFGGPEEKFEGASTQRSEFHRHVGHQRVRPIVPDLLRSDLHAVSAGKKLDASMKCVTDPSLKPEYDRVRREQLATMKTKGVPAKGGNQAAEALGAGAGAKMDCLSETQKQFARKVDKDISASAARFPDFGRSHCPPAVNPITGERRTLPVPPFEQPPPILGAMGKRSMNADERLRHRKHHPAPF